MRGRGRRRSLRIARGHAHGRRRLRRVEPHADPDHRCSKSEDQRREHDSDSSAARLDRGPGLRREQEEEQRAVDRHHQLGRDVHAVAEAAAVLRAGLDLRREHDVEEDVQRDVQRPSLSRPKKGERDQRELDADHQRVGEIERERRVLANHLGQQRRIAEDELRVRAGREPERAQAQSPARQRGIGRGRLAHRGGDCTGQVYAAWWCA